MTLNTACYDNPNPGACVVNIHFFAAFNASGKVANQALLQSPAKLRCDELPCLCYAFKIDSVSWGCKIHYH